VKKTRRRVTWGLRAFVIGLVVGILTAPNSGQRTRDMLQGFVEDLLDIVMPDDQIGGASAQ
ncbi:MAG: YtxH domain-containing protein, partial [Chloroflexota bacterium]|nr:YtxH domain-containing protein [Chloroflexota bacterium]